MGDVALLTVDRNSRFRSDGDLSPARSAQFSEGHGFSRAVKCYKTFEPRRGSTSVNAADKLSMGPAMLNNALAAAPASCGWL